MTVENVPFFCKSRDATACARGFLNGEAFRVCKGSTAKGHPNRYAQQRMVKDRVLKRIGSGLFEFTRDWVFSAPSPAASTVLGNDANGWERWRDEHGRRLREIAQRG